MRKYRCNQTRYVRGTPSGSKAASFFEQTTYQALISCAIPPSPLGILLFRFRMGERCRTQTALAAAPARSRVGPNTCDRDRAENDRRRRDRKGPDQDYDRKHVLRLTTKTSNTSVRPAKILLCEYYSFCSYMHVHGTTTATAFAVPSLHTQLFCMVLQHYCQLSHLPAALCGYIRTWYV